jgi:hypothetical protein
MPTRTQYLFVIVPASHGLPAEVRRVLEDAGVLRGRLLRLAVALAVSSTVAAEHLENLADRRGTGREDMLAVAREMRASAEACRVLQQQLQGGAGHNDGGPGGWGTVPL